MPSEALVQDVRARLPDEAHVSMFDDALAALASGNRQRAQHFAVTMRELFGHVLSSHVSDDDVKTCSWYEQEQGARGVTRRQRALYLSRGGLSDEFIRNTLKLDPDEFHLDISKAFDVLNKATHVRPNSPPSTPEEIEQFANLAIGSFAELFETIDNVRLEIDEAISPRLQDEAASTFIEQTVQDLDILAGHHYTTEGVLIDETSVAEIGSKLITYRVTGTVDVQLHYGGNSDPVQIDENFPFSCAIVAEIPEPFKFLDNMTTMQVDTSSWFGDDEGSNGDGDEGGTPVDDLPF